MTFPSPGRSALLSFKDSHGMPVQGVETSVPAGYTVEVVNGYQATVVGPPADAVALTTTSGGVSRTFPVRVWPATADLADLRADVDLKLDTATATATYAQLAPLDRYKAVPVPNSPMYVSPSGVRYRVAVSDSGVVTASDAFATAKWGYGGSTPAANAVSPALIDLAALGVPRVLWCPGAAGNYVSTPDVNLLPAHADSFEDGTTGGWSGTNSTVVNSASNAVHGSRSLAVTAAAAGDTVANSGYRIGVVAGQTYALAASAILTATRNLGVYVDFLDAAGAYMSSGGINTGDLPANTSQRRSVIITAPVGAVTAQLRIIMHTAVAGDVMYLDAVQVKKGADAPFTPSLRITGDIDLRAHVALEDWTPVAIAALVNRWNTGGFAYLFRVLTTGALDLTWRTPAGTSLGQFSPVPALTDGTPKHVRATLDVDNGAGGHDVRFWTSNDGVAWTQLGATITTAGVAEVAAGAAPLVVGQKIDDNAAGLKGKVLSASVRAGIDGPVVARYDATQHTDPTYTDTTGKVWTVSRSGDATAEIVDRNTWAFTGTEYLTLPDRPSLTGLSWYRDGQPVATPNPLFVGAVGTPLAGLDSTWAGFAAPLSTTRATELAAWDGKVATEPTWLRTEAVLYVTADDPAQASYYAYDNSVLNLTA